MNTSTATLLVRQRGMALVAALLLLVVITVLGVTMFRSYGLTERVAGNTREKERALAAALSTQAYAEFYLNGNRGSNSVQNQTCSGQGVTASWSSIMVCTNAISGNVAQVPWANSFTYTPPGMTVGTSTTAGSFTQSPQFYITYLGCGNPICYATGDNTAIFQIDAAAWGGAGNTVAVVESGYKVMTTYTVSAPSSTGVVPKNYSLTNP